MAQPQVIFDVQRGRARFEAEVTLCEDCIDQLEEEIEEELKAPNLVVQVTQQKSGIKLILPTPRAPMPDDETQAVKKLIEDQLSFCLGGHPGH